MTVGRLPLGSSEKVTCADTMAVALSGHAPLKCPGLLRIQQSPFSESAAVVLGAKEVVLGAKEVVLGAEEVPARGLSL